MESASSSDKSRGLQSCLQKDGRSPIQQCSNEYRSSFRATNRCILEVLGSLCPVSHMSNRFRWEGGAGLGFCKVIVRSRLYMSSNI